MASKYELPSALEAPHELWSIFLVTSKDMDLKYGAYYRGHDVIPFTILCCLGPCIKSFQAGTPFEQPKGLIHS